MRWRELDHQRCPIARSLSVVGDRWTLLILRDCFRGLSRFDAFRDSLGVTRHVLADRLRKLTAAGVLERVAYQTRPPRWEYRLTERGRELYPVLVTMLDWGHRHTPAPAGRPIELVVRSTGRPARPVVVDALSGEPIPPGGIRLARARA